MTRRILVAEAPLRRPGERRPVRVPARVAVVFWRNTEPPMWLMSVVVKATASFRGDGPHRVARYVQARPFSATPARADDDLPVSDELVPNKKLCDVLVSGSVEIQPLPSGELPTRHGTIRVADRSLSFSLGGRPGKVPLRAPFLQLASGGEPFVAARPTLDPASIDFVHREGFDFEVYQAAHPRLRAEFVEMGARLQLEALGADGGPLSIELPDVGARAMVDWARSDAPADADLFLDTVNVRLDDEEIDLVWRGFVEVGPQPRGAVDRVVVGFARDDEWPEDVLDEELPVGFGALLRELPHGAFSYAWERSDVLEGKEPPPLPEEELQMARHESFGYPLGPLPTLTLAEHARITAHLLEEREPRADVLRRHGFDELTWAAEERAFGDRMATLPSGDAEPEQHEFGRHLRAEQEALAGPADDRVTPSDYATIAVRLEVENPREVLKDVGLSLGAWMRIDRRYRERAAGDPGLEREIEQALERERERRGERREVEVDDQGRVVP